MAPAKLQACKRSMSFWPTRNLTVSHVLATTDVELIDTAPRQPPLGPLRWPSASNEDSLPLLGHLPTEVGPDIDRRSLPWCGISAADMADIGLLLHTGMMIRSQNDRIVHNSGSHMRGVLGLQGCSLSEQFDVQSAA